MYSRGPGLGRVAVIGLGQIGGSIAGCLTRQASAHVTGCDHDPKVVRKARKLGLAHEYTADVARALSGADIVILALPVASIIAALMDSNVPFEKNTLVMDVGSTKRLILEAADRRTPPIRFVGAHPLAGNEWPGLAGALPGLFFGAAFPLFPGRHARVSDLKLARRLVRFLGGRPIDMDAATHDRITGLTIGLPHVLALLLRDVYEKERSRDPRVDLLTGSSLRSAVRVSHSDPVMVGDLIASNRDQIEYWWHKLTGTPPSPRDKKRRGGR